MVLVKYFQCFSDGKYQFLTVPPALLLPLDLDGFLFMWHFDFAASLYNFGSLDKEGSGCPPPVTASDVDISDFFFLSCFQGN